MKSLSLRQKLLLLMLLVNVSATAVFTANSYRSDRANLLDGIDQKLLSCASAVTLELPDGYHDRIHDAKSIPADEYWHDLQRLSAYADRLNVTYVYTYMMFDGVIRTTASNATPKELASGSYTRFFDVYNTPSKGMLDAFATRQIQHDEYTDAFGHLRSVFIPMKTPGGRTYVAGADIAIGFIHQRLRSTLIQCVSIGVVMFVVVLAVTYIFIFRLSGPLVRLAAYTRHLTERHFALDPAQQEELASIRRKGGDEVGLLAGSILDMETKLGEYLRDLKVTTAAKERIESELKIARDIQRNILSYSFDLAGRDNVDLHAFMEPAKEVGGDLFDFFMIDERRLAVMVGDVSDKGVPAAFFMAVSVTLLRAHGSKDLSPAEVLTFVNRELCRHNEATMFVTVFLAVLDIGTGHLIYSNGGHNPPLLARTDGRVEVLPPTQGSALGVFEEAVFSNAEATLGPDDFAVLYTDGVTEAMNPNREQFTLKRLTALTAGHVGAQSTRVLIEAIVQEVQAFAKGCPQSDDITLLAVRRNKTV
jgi:sigma-B regulation protein RsbU (phosphoserine phosphatase)